MYTGKHGKNVDTLKPATVCGKQVEEIPWGDAGVETVRVSETPDPSVFNNLEDKGPASHFSGLDEQLGGDPGGSFSFHFFGFHRWHRLRCWGCTNFRCQSYS